MIVLQTEVYQSEGYENSVVSMYHAPFLSLGLRLLGN